MAFVVVPGEVVPLLRYALYDDLARVGSFMAGATCEPAEGEWAGPIARFDTVRAVLDVIGWSPTETDMQIDMREHGETVERVLSDRLDGERHLAEAGEDGQEWAANARAIERFLKALAVGRLLVALGRAIRELRHERGIDKRELASAAGLSTERLDAIEAGRLDPAYDVLLALVDGLGVGAGMLFARAEAIERGQA